MVNDLPHWTLLTISVSLYQDNDKINDISLCESIAMYNYKINKPESKGTLTYIKGSKLVSK